MLSPKFLALCSPLAKTLRLTLFCELGARGRSLRVPAALRPLPNGVPERGCATPGAVGCEVAVSDALR